MQDCTAPDAEWAWDQSEEEYRHVSRDLAVWELDGQWRIRCRGLAVLALYRDREEAMDVALAVYEGRPAPAPRVGVRPYQRVLSGDLSKVLLGIVRQRGPITAYEASLACGVEIERVSIRLSALRRKGLVAVSGRRSRGQGGGSGRPAHVYEIANPRAKERTATLAPAREVSFAELVAERRAARRFGREVCR